MVWRGKNEAQKNINLIFKGKCETSVFWHLMLFHENDTNKI